MIEGSVPDIPVTPFLTHGREEGLLSAWPAEEPVDWMALVNRPQDVAEEEVLKQCIGKGRPFGSALFDAWTVEELDLSAALRERGRPRKDNRENDS